MCLCACIDLELWQCFLASVCVCVCVCVCLLFGNQLCRINWFAELFESWTADE